MIVFSLISAVTVALEAFFNRLPLKVFAAVMTILVSGLATVLKTFSYQEKWALYRKMCNDLENEWDLYEARVGDYEKIDDKEQYFVMRIRALLDQSNTTIYNLTLPPYSTSKR